MPTYIHSVIPYSKALAHTLAHTHTNKHKYIWNKNLIFQVFAKFPKLHAQYLKTIPKYKLYIPHHNTRFMTNNSKSHNHVYKTPNSQGIYENTNKMATHATAYVKTYSCNQKSLVSMNVYIFAQYVTCY